VISAFTCAEPADDVTHNVKFAIVLVSHVHLSSIQTESLLTTGTATSYGSKSVDHLDLAN